MNPEDQFDGDDWDADAAAEAREQAYQRAEAKGLIRYFSGGRGGAIRGPVVKARDIQPAATSRTASGIATIDEAVKEHRLMTNDFGTRTAMVAYVSKRCGLTEAQASEAIAKNAVASHRHQTTF